MTPEKILECEVVRLQDRLDCALLELEHAETKLAAVKAWAEKEGLRAVLSILEAGR